MSFSLSLLTFLAMIGFFSSWFQPLLARCQKASYIVAGSLLIFFGLFIGEWFPIKFLMREYGVRFSNKLLGFVGSYLVGLAFTVGWTPCVGPILGSIFAMSPASKVNATVLLVSYGLGLSVPFLLVGLFFNSFLTGCRGLRPHIPIVIKVSSGILILTGVLLFSGVFARFPEYFSFIPSFEFLLQNVMVPTIPLAFAGGILSFISPCLPPIVPSFLAYVTGVSLSDGQNSHRSFFARNIPHGKRNLLILLPV